jgi:hypothetical protein
MNNNRCPCCGTEVASTHVEDFEILECELFGLKKLCLREREVSFIRH